MQRLGLFQLALSTVQLRQVVQAAGRLGVLRPQNLLFDDQRPPVQRRSLLQPAPFTLDRGQAAQCHGHFVVSGTKHPGIDGQRLSVYLLRLLQLMLAEQRSNWTRFAGTLTRLLENPESLRAPHTSSTNTPSSLNGDQS